MNISGFFNSYIGMYVAESFFHSLIAAIIVERATQTWRIRNPFIKQRFLFIVILLPIFSFPVFQLINPQRGSISFRLEALLDVNKWLNLELWGKLPLNFVFIFILSATAAIFIVQEMIPVIRHTMQSKKNPPAGKTPAEDSLVNKALEALPVGKPDVFIIEDDDLIVFSTTGSRPAVFLSTGIINELSLEQIQVVITHEIAHIERSKRPLLIIVFFLRILMFFNPVVLIEFRKSVQEEEKICDDIAVSLTHKPVTLAETLKKLYLTEEKLTPGQIKDPSRLRKTLEDYGHNMHIKSRIVRLEQGTIQNTDGEWFKFVITLVIIVVINYFVV